MTMPASPPPAITSSPFASWRGEHSGIRVPDFDEAVKWYTEKLDFRVVYSWPFEHGITFAYISPAEDDTFRLELMGGAGASAKPSYKDLPDSLTLLGWHHIGIHVDDVDKSVAELKSRGVTIVTEPMDYPPISRRFAFIADPWGNLFELIKPIAS